MSLVIVTYVPEDIVRASDSRPLITMDLNQDGKYETELTVLDEENRANHIQYIFKVNDDGTEYSLTDDSWVANLDLPDPGNGGTTNGDNNTPGFELLVLFIAIIIGIIVYKKKR